ncbi:unnamed protein product [Caenorhabditis angaria]|uniref:Uncharacterized protein n=1 Tax=Caenorhabditis angaria TaxID=860376 RepID=A0A9P1IXL7_9PELO|nr:unnamed protein product [Caenorhabditis angaria]
MRQEILNKMSALERHVFSRCSKQAYFDVSRNEHYIKTLRLKRISKSKFEISLDFEDKYCVKHFHIKHMPIIDRFLLKSARSLESLKLTENKNLIWTTPPLTFFKLRNVVLTTKRVNAILLKIKTRVALNSLAVNPGFRGESVDVSITKIKEVMDSISMPSCNLLYENLKMLRASHVRMGLVDTNSDRLLDYLRSWRERHVENSLQRLYLHLHKEMQIDEIRRRLEIVGDPLR